MRPTRLLLAFVLALSAVTIGDASAPPIPRPKPAGQAAAVVTARPTTPVIHSNWADAALPFGIRLSAAAAERARHAVRYDAAYIRIPYPMGDVPADQGVCSDEVIRSYRLLGIDLQRLVHEDMARAFNRYPRTWGLKSPDSNIDHRRVPNLATFFSRHGQSLPVTGDAKDYKPGDVIAWALPDGRPHTGIVTQERTGDGARPLVLHNIGRGPQIEDMLFGLTITGHYRYEGPKRRVS